MRTFKKRSFHRMHYMSAVPLTDYYVISKIFASGRGGHDGRMQLRDVWASSDGGRSWTQVCQTAQWEGMYVFNE